jgi:undecaprenyl diphosphate synthase
MEGLTKNATGLKLTFAFNYGGRSEIVRAVNSFQLNHPDRLITEGDLNGLMYRPETGDVDLMIRTGGEQRISNFLIWQMAYAELYFTPTKWPDFTPSEFRKIVDHVSCRERRFGNVCGQGNLGDSMDKAENHKTAFVEGAKH